MIETTELMTKEELKKYLGVKDTIFKNLLKEGIPCLRLSPYTLRFIKGEVDQWLKDRSIRSNELPISARGCLKKAQTSNNIEE